MALTFVKWAIKVIFDLRLLYQFLTKKHWIYNEREVLIKSKPKKNSQVIVVIKNKTELRQFLSEHVI